MTQTTQATQTPVTGTQPTGTQLLEKILEQLEHQTVSMDALCTRLDSLHQAVNGASNGSPDGHEDKLVEFDATEIVTTLDDSGTRKLFRIKGGMYSAYGIRIWPESLPELGIDPGTLTFGINPISMKVRARITDRGKKVIGLAEGGAS